MMRSRSYRSMPPDNSVDRRDFLKRGAAAAAALAAAATAGVGDRFLFAHESGQTARRPTRLRSARRRISRMP